MNLMAGALGALGALVKALLIKDDFFLVYNTFVNVNHCLADVSHFLP